MMPVRNQIGGLGNLMFKQAYLYGKFLDSEIPDVYVQSERYWKTYAHAIRSEFSKGIKGKLPFTSIHVRRGDYLRTNDFYVDLCESDYYQKALGIFPKNTQYMIFCRDNQDPEQDKVDRKWCLDYFARYLKSGQFSLAPYGSETEELNMMATCENNIMANSSFSWWAAYLNPNPDKKVICPEKWFQDGIQRCELLDEWTKI